jgi:electron transfer flavoprotein alpha subunit
VDERAKADLTFGRDVQETHMEHRSGVLAVGEVDAEGKIRALGWEILTAARQITDGLGGEVTGLLLGHGIADMARLWGSAGADKLLIADDPKLAGLTPSAGAAALQQAIAVSNPAIVLVPGTTAGRDYAPIVAARLSVGLAADCTDLAVIDGTLSAARPVFGGRAVSCIRFDGDHLAMATVHAGSFAKSEPGRTAPAVDDFRVNLTESDVRVSVVETTSKGSGVSRLDTAEVVVSGGRGLKEPAQFTLVEELADALGGAVGATRAVVDAGWRPHQEQIGQTGRTVSPRLYVAVGISGAVQHNVGMQGSDFIVAVNRDPDAPIFKFASFGIVGDLFDVVPALTAAIRNAKS